jgi:hypothetical protein
MTDRFNDGARSGADAQKQQKEEFSKRAEFIKESTVHFNGLVSRHADKFKPKNLQLRMQEGKVHMSVLGWNGYGPEIQVCWKTSLDSVEARIAACWHPERTPEYVLLAEGSILKGRIGREVSNQRDDVEYWLGKIYASF